MARFPVRQCLLVALLGVLAGCDSSTAPPIPVASVVVGPGNSTVDPETTVQYGVVVSDVNGAQLQGRQITWSVVDTSLATISPAGLLTAKTHPGAINRSTFVRADVGGKFGVSSLAVRPAVVSAISVNRVAATLQDGDAVTLTVAVRDARGNVLAGRQPTWTSRDPLVARVTAEGVLTPVGFVGGGNRTARIIASVESVFDSITVAVAPTELTSLILFPAQPFLQPGWAKTLRVEGRSPRGNVVLGLSPSFTSSNPAVATVNTAGTVTSLPDASGSTNVSASVGGFTATVNVTVDACGAAAAGTYPLEIRFFGPNPPTTVVQEAFVCAANRIRAIIRDPLPTVNLNNASLSSCIGEAVTLNEVSSGLIIYAKVDSIDGPGRVLGSAGPCFVNSSTRTPVVGVMRFDEADLSTLAVSGRLLDVVMHEMLHVVGIGTMWRDDALNPRMWTGAVTDPGFLGLRARAACVDFHSGANICLNQVPIEDCVGITGCGAGTLHGHWRELIFRRELMTGYVSPAGQQNPFSRMTIEALADLGYSVDSDQSNDYVIPTPGLMGLFDQGSRRGELQMPAPLLPTHTVDPMGRLRPIIR